MPMLRYNYFLQGSLMGAEGVLKRNINVPFEPDELLVRYSMYDSDGNEPPSYIKSDLIDPNEILGVFEEGLLANLDTLFTIKKPVNGTFTFFFYTLDGVFNNIPLPNPVAPGNDFRGDLMVHLEFRKYD